ncbi:ATP-dependent DNA helicase RecQ [uncultured Candidatus Thioglobus sp.]|nr:ATP-dependent DNA helicase RecQ [uncultured Candidatus Thioglobus sp.]
MTIEDKKLKILQDTFGFDCFRALQNETIDKILAGEDVLLILPTGGGKSLCYQLPALLMEGVLVVVSPLLALMQDQILGLKSKGIRAEMMSSMQSTSEIIEIENALQAQQVKVLFVAPERLQNQRFLDFLKSLKIAFFAVDEAHCVSEWGHEFRADYRELGLLKTHFPDISVAAFTATATKQVEKDIVVQLNFKQSNNIIRGSVFRDSLYISALARQGNGRQQLLDFLAKHPNEQGIIYAQSRAKTEKLSEFLVAQGLKAQAYHAGLDTQVRKAVFADFIGEKTDIMVATIAFGMGIDKSDIRFVVHTSMPKTIEAYYQEIGRAGRDGLLSEVLLLYNASDLGILTHFIQEIDNQEYRNRAFKKLNLIKQYAFSEGCRHQALSQYFDDNVPACKTLCDNCLNPDVERQDISQMAQKFLSAIYRTGQLFGQNHIIDVLRGSKNQKVLNNEHNKLSVYGVGVESTQAQWRIIGERLLELDIIIISGEYSSLKLTSKAMAILKSEEKVDIRASSLDLSQKVVSIKKSNDYEVDAQIFEALRGLRAKIAKETAMPAYIIFDNKTLNEMGYFLPDSKEKLLQINGVGEIKYEKYGEQFLSLLDTLRDDNFVEPQRQAPAVTVVTTAQKNPTDEAEQLSATYHSTLDLIQQDFSVEAIVENRNLATSTVLGHINKLVDNNLLDGQIRQQLFATLPMNPALDDWVEQGIALAGSIDSIQSYLSVYRQLQQGKE